MKEKTQIILLMILILVCTILFITNIGSIYQIIQQENTIQTLKENNTILNTELNNIPCHQKKCTQTTYENTEVMTTTTIAHKQKQKVTIHITSKLKENDPYITTTILQEAFNPIMKDLLINDAKELGHDVVYIELLINDINEDVIFANTYGIKPKWK